MGRHPALVAVTLPVAGLALGAAWGPWLQDHTLSGHMLQHLVTMNVAALLLAAAAIRPPVHNMLAAATIAQVVLLWGWHLPIVLDAARHDSALMVPMQASLFAVALLFWSAVLAHPVERSWQAILASLVTAKAFCLFGAILCFARGALYAAHGHAPEEALEDQQLAGLLMMGSCALVYVTASVVLFVRWMNHLSRNSAARSARWSRVNA